MFKMLFFPQSKSENDLTNYLAPYKTITSSTITLDLSVVNVLETKPLFSNLSTLNKH